jgi:hypothetical protein
LNAIGIPEAGLDVGAGDDGGGEWSAGDPHPTASDNETTKKDRERG